MITTLAWVVLLTALTRPLRQVLRPSGPARKPRMPDAVFAEGPNSRVRRGPAGAQPWPCEFRDFAELCKRRGAARDQKSGDQGVRDQGSGCQESGIGASS